MNNIKPGLPLKPLASLKQILIKMARLSRRDQRWILNALSPTQKKLFQQVQGKSLLLKAWRFRHLQEQVFMNTDLSPAQRTLANYSPLYIAIVLEQGQYPWQDSFLQCIDCDGMIKALLTREVKKLKPTPKQKVFSQWQSHFSFENQLESHHG